MICSLAQLHEKFSSVTDSDAVNPPTYRRAAIIMAAVPRTSMPFIPSAAAPEVDVEVEAGAEAEVVVEALLAEELMCSQRTS